jgi:hypothetical protein
MDDKEVNQGQLVTLMRTEIFEIDELKMTPLRTFCVMLDENNYCDAAELINETNDGAMINDGFDASLYNVTGEGLKLDKDPDEWVPIIQIIAKRKLVRGEELYLEYGKLYWCYRGNFDTLPLAQQVKCRAHYKIIDSDFIKAVAEPKKKKKTVAKKAKRS